MRNLYFLIILLAIFPTSLSIPSNETLKARLNLSFFKFFSKAGRHVVDKEIPNITVPNVTFPFSTPVGDGQVTTNELKIDKFVTPAIDFVLSDHGISWSTRGGGVKLNGLWAAEFTELVTVHDSGWVTAIATDIRMNLSATVYARDGKPQIFIGGCTVDIVHLDVQIGGSVVSWLVNLFRTPFSGLLKSVIHNQACTAARGILLQEANEFLHSLPAHIDIGKNFFVDYFLVKSPKATPGYAEFDLSADVVYGNETCKPYRDIDWIDAGPDPRMVTTWLSEAVPNCLLSSAHNGQLVKFAVTKDIPAVSDYLKTSCTFFSICIGRFFTQLRTKYPNKYIDLFFHTHTTPIISLKKDDGVKLNITFAVDFYINPMKIGEENVLARLVLDSSSDVLPRLHDGRIGGELLNSTISLKEDFSKIGDVSEMFLRTFTNILSVTAKEAIKSVLTVGVPIPSFDNVTVADTTKIDIFDEYLRLNVDFEYK